MKGLGATTAALAQFRKRAADQAASRTAAGGQDPSGVVETLHFGENPGGLRMLSYAPSGLAPGRPLVVALHGCTQTAAGYIRGSGWAALAERLGFVLVCPEQTTANNSNTCFNWFNPEDVRRGGGEVASIREMIAHAVSVHGCDGTRVFVTGLSAGGAMAAAMLAAYPEVFAAGAIIAGLPYRAANNVREAFGYMMQATPRPASAWGDLVRAGSGHTGPWPRVSIWHGDRDNVVVPQTAGELVKQWTDVHGLAATPDRCEQLGAHTRDVWFDSAGQAAVESYTLAGLGHGTPIGGRDAVGAAGPFFLTSTLSSSEMIAESWGLDREAAFDQPRQANVLPKPSAEPARPKPSPQIASPAHSALKDQTSQVGAIINGALRAAGLMRR